MFNNDLYTDFWTAWKHVLMPIDVIRVIYQKMSQN